MFAKVSCVPFIVEVNLESAEWSDVVAEWSSALFVRRMIGRRGGRWGAVIGIDER
jgi:hypothetical protein